MSGEIEELTLTAEEGGADVDPGTTGTGIITGAQVRSFTGDDGDQIQYYQLLIDDEETEIEFNPDWPAKVTPGTGLGRLLQRFGERFSPKDDVDVHDVFDIGLEVEYEFDEEESSDPDDDQTFLRIDEETVRPAGEPLDPDLSNSRFAENGEAGEGEHVCVCGDSFDSEEALNGHQASCEEYQEEGEEDDLRVEVLEFVGEREGSDDSEVKKDIAKELGGQAVQAYKSLKSDGDIETEDGAVLLSG